MVRVRREGVYELLALVVGLDVGVIEIARVLDGNLVTLSRVVGAIATTEDLACDTHDAN